MELKQWTYEEFPAFDTPVEGAFVLPTTGDEWRVRYIPNVRYDEVDGTPLTLQILRPFTRNRPEPVLPCVVFVQGSGWMKQDVYFQVPALSKLAERGYIVAIVEYRHSGIASFPAPIVDARNAVRFLRSHAGEYGVDPDRMIVAGDSSGGHTAVFAGLRHNDDTAENHFPGVSAEVKGIVNYYGSCGFTRPDSNPSTPNHNLPDSPEGLEMGGANLRERPDLVRALSAECNIAPDTDVAPMLILHGTKDRTVNAWCSVDLYNQLKRCGKDAELFLLDGADHGGGEFWTDGVLDIVQRFIERCLAG